MANVGIADIPDNAAWVRQLKSAPAVRITGQSQATTDRGATDLPDNSKWVAQMQSAPAARATGQSEAVTNRGVASLIMLKKRKPI